MPAKTTRPRTYLEAWRTRIRPHLARLRRAKRRLRLPRFVTIGYFCDIDPTVRFMPHNGARIVIGDWVRIRRYGELLGPVTIGSRTRINRDVYIRPNTTIGRDVRIAAFVRVLTDHHDIQNAPGRLGQVCYKPIVIEDGAWIGAGTTILPGKRIGHGAVVGACSVVTRDVPPNTVWAGNPARMLRELEPLSSIPEEVFGAGPHSLFRPPVTRDPDVR